MGSIVQENVGVRAEDLREIAQVVEDASIGVVSVDEGQVEAQVSKRGRSIEVPWEVALDAPRVVVDCAPVDLDQLRVGIDRDQLTFALQIVECRADDARAPP